MRQSDLVHETEMENHSSSWNDETFIVRLDGFEGPLDMLLQLAKTQKVDLTQISILPLVEQYLQIIESAKKIRLELAADWLVMASWLAWLKSCLLLPQKTDHFGDTEQAVDLLQERLQGLEQINKAALWMQERPLLGSEVFARGYYEDLTSVDSSGLILDSARFIDAYIRIFHRKNKKREWRIRSFHFWTVKDALNRLKRLLKSHHVPGWHALDAFLPRWEAVNKKEQSPVQQQQQWKAAWCGMLLAGLELAKLGEIKLDQQEQFGQIRLQSRNENQSYHKNLEAE
ncbi:segregation and condensation protein A [Commensalibacter melissae]|uniref:segregation and condensation protein A n=1 Tax=Commensalibacter melissae TaxID=2070537 RepID=UPI001F119CEF|nr:ScpA family protein [Commensalibacter melissae]